MLKRSELSDPRMKYTPQEIALYNSSAYEKVTHSMIIVKGQDKWIAPDIKGILNDKRSR